MIRPVNRREMLKLFPKRGVMAELGVFRGMFSQRIVEQCNPKKLYLVDTWGESIDWLIDGKIVNVSGDAAYRHVCELFDANKQVALRRQTTVSFLSSLPDASLDLIYLDADHAYESVRDELALLWPRIKPGGWVSGHDYCTLFPGVIKAVSEFLKLHNLTLDVLTDEAPGIVINCPNGPKEMAYNSFAFRKPA